MPQAHLEPTKNAYEALDEICLGGSTSLSVFGPVFSVKPAISLRLFTPFCPSDPDPRGEVVVVMIGDRSGASGARR